MSVYLKIKYLKFIAYKLNKYVSNFCLKDIYIKKDRVMCLVTIQRKGIV